MDGEVVALRDRAHLLQEEVTLKAAEQTNRHLEVLAIVATIFLPPTLVAGIFGMNVAGTFPLSAISLMTSFDSMTWSATSNAEP